MKRKMIGWLMALMLVVLCGTAVQALMLGGGNTGTTIVLSGVMENLDKDIILLEEDEILTVDHFPTGEFGAYLDSTGRGQLVPVVWELEADGLEEPGLHEVTGRPILSETVTLADGYDGLITWPVFRKGEGAVLNVESFREPKISITDILLPENCDCTANLPGHTALNDCRIRDCWLLNVRKNPEFYWEWDLSAVDTSVPGSYPVTAELHCPDWLVIYDEFRQYEQTVYVLPEDRIEIFAGIHLAENGELTIHWLYDSGKVTEAVLETENADGLWESCPEEWYAYFPQNSLREAYLLLKLSNFPKETPVTLRLRYMEQTESGSSERTTESVHLQVPENWKELLKHYEHTPVLSVLDGDRDGGDHGGAVLPDMEQTIPVPKPDDTMQKIQNDILQYLRLMKEIVTDTSTTVSGLRVNVQTSLGKTVLFEKKGAAAEIPSELLKNLSLAASDMLKVTILCPTKDSVQISVMVNDSLVDDLTGTVIRMPWKKQPEGRLVCLDADGNEVSEGIYDRQSGTVQFSVTASGVYDLQEAVSDPQENTV